MANTPNLNLPKISSNMTADVVRDLNALADAVDANADAKYATQTALTNIINDLSSATWYDLPLQNGAIAYSTGSVPQYTKIGGFVVVKGALKGIMGEGTYATLPPGYRPVGITWNFIQNASKANGYANFARWVINTNGTIAIEGISQGLGDFASEVWFPIHTVFPVF